MPAKRSSRKVIHRKFRPKDVSLITSVQRIKMADKRKDRAYAERWYWFGYYRRPGISYRVYIGVKLPKSLEALFSERVWNPVTKMYYWPRSRHNPDKLKRLKALQEDQGDIDQASGRDGEVSGNAV